MTIEEKEPSRAERILAGTVAFTICMAVVFAIVAIFIGWRWSLRMFVGVLLIGIPGEILLELVGENRMSPRGGGKPGQTSCSSESPARSCWNWLARTECSPAAEANRARHELHVCSS